MSIPTAITVSVQAQPHDGPSWLALARRLEWRGFEALLVADHPGSTASPWPALGAAAAVTTTLGIGTYVLQCGVRDPVQAAADAATLNLLAPGRVLLGMGAGHTFREWEATGGRRPSASDRAGRLAEFVEAVDGLLRGDRVTLDGRYLHLVDAHLDGLDCEERVRLAVGGGNPTVLRTAAGRADVVALSGLGRTLPDGHSHDVRWTPADLDRQLALVREESLRAGRSPELEALVQVVQVTEDRPAALADLAAELPSASLDDLAQTPFVLIGTIAEMAAQLRRQSEELGISRYVVREPAVEVMEQVLARLGIAPMTQPARS